MKQTTTHSTAIIATIAALATFAQAETFTVFSGDSIQNVVNLAAPDDTILITEGIYTELVSIDKPLTIIGALDGTNRVALTSEWSIRNVAQTVRLQNFQAVAMNIVSSKVEAAGLLWSSCAISDSDVSILNCQIPSLSVANPRHKLTVARSRISGAVSITATNLVFGYNSVSGNGYVALSQCASGIVIGNRFVASCECLLKVENCGPLTIANNVLTNYRGGSLFVANSSPIARNNYLSTAGGWWGTNWGGWGRDILGPLIVSATGSRPTFVGNHFVGNHVTILILAPVSASFYNNSFYNYESTTVFWDGGCIPSGSIIGDPLFVPNSDYVLATNSPCINAGPLGSLYADRDGSRNDIGIWGGALYDPDGLTTTNPVVCVLELTPQSIQKGNNITLRGAAVAP